MKYVCLVYYDENLIDNMTSEEWKALNAECEACVRTYAPPEK